MGSNFAELCDTLLIKITDITALTETAVISK